MGLMVVGVLCVPTLTRAYTLRVNGDGKVLIWKHKKVSVHLDLSNAPDLGGLEDAVEMGFLVWTSNGLPAEINFSSSKKPFSTGNDGTNVVRWETEEWPYGEEVVATTVSTYEKESGLVIDSDIIANGVDHKWGVAPAEGSNAYDVQNVIAHEAGHFFGLGHEQQDPESTMFPTTPSCEQKKRTLSEDDRLAVAALIEEMDRRNIDEEPQSQSLSAGGSSASPEDPDAAAGDPAQGPVDPDGAAMGCSAGGGSAGGSAGMVFLLIVLLAMTRVRRLLASILAGLLLIPLMSGSAAATLVTSLSLDELANRSPVVVRAEVVSSKGVRVGRMIYTEHKLQVQQCLKGSCEQTMTLRTVGGVVGNVGMHIDGAAQLMPGDRVVVFARKRASVLRTVGLAQGLFHVTGQQLMRDLRGLQLVGPPSYTTTIGHNAPHYDVGTMERHSLVEIERIVQQSALQGLYRSRTLQQAR